MMTEMLKIYISNIAFFFAWNQYQVRSAWEVTADFIFCIPNLSQKEELKMSVSQKSKGYHAAEAK